jgi:hypothetical protein
MKKRPRTTLKDLTSTTLPELDHVDLRHVHGGISTGRVITVSTKWTWTWPSDPDGTIKHDDS